MTAAIASADHADTAENDSPLARAIHAAGGPSKLSRFFEEMKGLKISPQAIGQWDECPADRVLALEEASGVSRYELRPDVFGEDPAAKADPVSQEN